MSGIANMRYPNVEMHTRIFNESSRFYNMFDHQKIHGVKKVPEPHAETVKNLKDEIMLFDIRA